LPRRKTAARRMQDKALKALLAKTPKGRANYLIDLLADEALEDSLIDSILHFFNEVALAEGPSDRNLQTFIRKTVRHPNTESEPSMPEAIRGFY
jgi:hypothetical protein